MPHITLPTTFTDNTTLPSSGAKDNIYQPQYTPTSLEVMNGRLDKDNLNVATAPAISREIVRKKAHASAITRGQTANMDLYKDFYLGDYDAKVNDEALQEGLVVTGLTFDIPYDCEAVYLSWHIGLIIDAGYAYSVDAGPARADVDSTGDGVADTFATPLSRDDWSTMVYVAVDGRPREELSRRMASGWNSMLGQFYYNAGGNNKKKYIPDGTYSRECWNDVLTPDFRWWSGHTIVDQVNDNDFIPSGDTQFWTKGQHTIDLRVTLGNWNHAVAPNNKITVRQVRVKTCRITAIPVR